MKKLFIMAAVLTIGSHAFCYNAREIVGEKNYEILQKEGKIQLNRFNDEDNDLELLPDTEISRKLFEGWKNHNLTSMAGENLYLVPKNGSSIKDVSVILRSVSRLEGTTYYSNRKKRTEVLYKNAYCIKMLMTGREYLTLRRETLMVRFSIVCWMTIHLARQIIEYPTCNRKMKLLLNLQM